MPEWLPAWLETEFAFSLLMSLALIAGIFTIRWLLKQLWLSRLDLTAADRRRWRSNSRNLALVVCIFALAFVWGPELRTFALSLVAVAAALAIATKELLLCLVAAIYRAATGSIKVGDWIVIDQPNRHTAGEVIDMTLLSIKIQELCVRPAQSMHGGRLVVVPNSVLLTEPLINESNLGHFCLETARVCVSSAEEVEAAKSNLLEAAREVCARYEDKIGRFTRKLDDLLEADVANIGPRVLVEYRSPTHVDLTVYYWAPLQRRTSLYEALLDEYHRRRAAAKAG